jgi:aminopeptidase N
MSMLGSNERQHTWMDEGLNTYYQFRYEAEKYRGNSIFGKNIPENVKKLPTDEFLKLVYTTMNSNIPMNSAMDTPADKFPSSDEYGLVSYVKTAVWLYVLESVVGKQKVDLAMNHYFSKWKHKHPQPADLHAAFEESIGVDLDEFFMLTKKEGKLVE